MPTWLIAPLIVAVAVIFALWAEAKTNVIIAELHAIRENLDKLWSDRAEAEEASGEINPPSV
jgi:hypothetical protein